MSNFVAVEINSEVEIHLPHYTGNYYTLCGMDGDDPDYSVDQAVAIVPRGAKVNCRSCKAIFDLCREFTRDDFSNE